MVTKSQFSYGLKNKFWVDKPPLASPAGKKDKRKENRNQKIHIFIIHNLNGGFLYYKLIN